MEKDIEYFYKIEKNKKIYDLNISTYFLLPLILKRPNINFNLYQLITKYSFREAFKWSEGDLDDLRCLYLVFEESQLEEDFLKLASNLEIPIEDDFYFENYNGNFWVVKTKISDEVPDEDIIKILKGEYSKISEETKNIYPKSQIRETGQSKCYFISLEDIELEYEIIKRSDKALYMLNYKYDLELDHGDLEDVEYWDRIDINKEILNCKTFKIK